MSVVLIAVLVIVAAHLMAAVIATRVITASINAENPPTGRFVSVTGGRLHLVDSGARAGDTGPAILLLHGATGNARDMMMAVGDLLSREHRVIAIDRPGHGHSDRPAGRRDAAPARQSALIVEALDALGVEKVIVVGFSLAGSVATNLALDHADRVAGLVLLAAVTHPWPGGVTWYYDVAAHPIIGPLFVSTVMTPVGSFRFGDSIAAAFAPNKPPADYARDSGASLVLRPDAFTWNAQDVADLLPFVVEQSRRYGEINVPTAVLHGEEDRTVYASIHSIPIAAQIAGAQLTLLPGVGHMLHHSAKELVLAEIRRVAEAARRH